MLVAGNTAPTFSLSGDDGRVHSLSDFLGKPLVIFFYPKDLTPGCTMEACGFSALSDKFAAHQAQIIGISKDSLASHARFKSIFSLRMLLLSDPELAVHKLYHAYGDKSLYGKLSSGVIRSSFLIDEKGVIIKSWYKVRVKNHVESVLETLSKR